MAGAYSSRPKRRNARLGGNRPRTHPSPNKPHGKAPRPSKVLSGQLRLLALRLEVIYRTAVTVEMALRYQKDDQDDDIADCIRHAVSTPIWALSEKAHSFAKRIGKVEAGRERSATKAGGVS